MNSIEPHLCSWDRSSNDLKNNKGEGDGLPSFSPYFLRKEVESAWIIIMNTIHHLQFVLIQ